MKQTVINSWGLILIALSASGCNEEEDRYKKAAEVAERATEQQARQNTEMARLNREVAEGTRRMIEADAVARQEIVEVHRELQSERNAMQQSYDALEAERKQISQQRRTESMLIPVVRSMGVTLVVLAVLSLCCLALFGLRGSDATDAELSDLLIDDLTSQQPQLFAYPDSPPAIEHHQHGESEPPLIAQAGNNPGEPTEEGETN